MFDFIISKYEMVPYNFVLVPIILIAICFTIYKLATRKKKRVKDEESLVVTHVGTVSRVQVRRNKEDASARKEIINSNIITEAEKTVKELISRQKNIKSVSATVKPVDEMTPIAEPQNITVADILPDNSVAASFEYEELPSTGWEDDIDTSKIVKHEENNDMSFTILVVDDSNVVRKYVSQLLKKNSYNVITKNDGLEALNAMLENQVLPDLIISDIEMPNLDGIEYVKKLREEKRFVNIPVIIISAHAAKHIELLEKQLISGFIKKPFKDEDLLQQISYLL